MVPSVVKSYTPWSRSDSANPDPSSPTFATPKIAVLVHGLFSSAKGTSLRSLQAQLEADGYKVVFIDYNSLGGNPDDEIQKVLDENSNAQVTVIGHSLGGKHVTDVALNNKGRPNTRFVTVNSPFAVDGAGVENYKNTNDELLNIVGWFAPIFYSKSDGVGQVSPNFFLREGQHILGWDGRLWFGGHEVTEDYYDEMNL